MVFNRQIDLKQSTFSELDLEFVVCKMASAESGESKPAGEEGAAANPEHINLKVSF